MECFHSTDLQQGLSTESANHLTSPNQDSEATLRGVSARKATKLIHRGTERVGWSTAESGAPGLHLLPGDTGQNQKRLLQGSPSRTTHPPASGRLKRKSGCHVKRIKTARPHKSHGLSRSPAWLGVGSQAAILSPSPSTVLLPAARTSLPAAGTRWRSPRCAAR